CAGRGAPALFAHHPPLVADQYHAVDPAALLHGGRQPRRFPVRLMAWNFAAGTARLPDAVLARAADELFMRGADGASAIERPFTGAAFRAVLDGARSRLAELLDLPANYRILFLAGGAMQQFSLLPMNLLGPSEVAAYADSGYWSRRAMAEASKLAPLQVVARHPGAQPLAAPPLGRWALPGDCAYCHITPNETVDGIAYPDLPDTGE